MWNPQLSTATEPKYQALVEALQRDVEAGVLQPGTRLPPHRELANRLGIAIGTVSRAYAIAERRGIVRGQVGRGTFVGRQDPSYQEGADEGHADELYDLSRGRLVRASDDLQLARTLEGLSQRAGLNQLIDIYQPPNGMLRHRAAGAAWIRRSGLDVTPDRVVVTSGAQHGAAVVLASIARPGDLILTEAVTYSGIKALANLLRLRLQGLPMDSDGLRPDALEAACHSSSPRALFCMSTLQNPTGRTMPVARRQQLGAIAEAYGLMVLEDDVNGFVPAEPLPPIATFAPAQTFYITGTSKSMAPGVRIGYVVPPAHEVEHLSSTIQATTWFTAPMMAELVTEWIEGGEADAMASWKRTETAVRHARAVEILGPWLPSPRPISFHLWIELPEPWRAESFVSQARAREVVVNSAEEFLVGRETAPHAVRVCLGAALSRARLEEGLTRLAQLLSTPPKPSPMVY